MFMGTFIGSADICIRDSDQPLPLTSEIYFLRKQNQVLNDMLAKGSQGKIRALGFKGTPKESGGQ